MMAAEEKKEQKVKGLKMMRSGYQGASKPEHHCDNCGCDRYSQCGCMRKSNNG